MHSHSSKLNGKELLGRLMELCVQIVKKSLIVSLPLVILLTLCAIQASAEENYEKRAQKHLDLMNYNQAARDLERAIEKKPHKDGLRVKLILKQDSC
jgi:hypothetical protein